jgi:hypothetical protein
MKKIQLLAFVLIASSIMPLNLLAQTSPSIKQYIDKNGANERFHASVILQHCGGLMLAYGRFLPGKETKEKFGQMASTLVLAAGDQLARLEQTSADEAFKQATEGMLYYQDPYYKKIEKTQRDTGSIFEGEVGLDFQLCQEYLKGLQ